MVQQNKDYEEKNSRVSLKKVLSLMRLRMKKRNMKMKRKNLSPSAN
jgi:hypothetical protein